VTATDLRPAALLEALHAALDADPSDAATRQVLADLMEDQGDPAGARGQRWQAEYGRWPACVPCDDGRGWRWWDAKHSVMDDPDDVPHEVFRALPGAGKKPMAVYYPTRRAAEADLVQALETSASREARLAGYDGEPCPWCGERKQVSSGRDRACDGCGRRWVT
jgi:ssDNA-binding Zn-finger/Zn-ribbon topoisomerase 1